MTRISLKRMTMAMAVAGLVGGGASGCGSSGGTVTGSGGTVGSGGSPTGSGGEMGSGGAPGSGGTPGSGGAPGSGGTVVDTGGSGGSAPDAPVDVPREVGSGLHGGTSGRYICPAGGNYAGMTPMLSGAMMMSTGANTLNGEGPIWISSLNTLLYTSKSSNEVIRLMWKLVPPNAAQVAVKMGIGNNGMTLDQDDKVVSADHQRSAIVRIDPATGDFIETVVEQYNGNFFKSPNDLVIRYDGNIYFSDPAYFQTQGKTPKTASTAFYRVSPTKQVSIIENTGTRDPNGVTLSADDNTLYTVVTADRLVKKWALNADGSINGAGTTFVPMTGPTPDGMCTDCAGNIYVSTQSGLEVYSPAGMRLANLGTRAINCSFGGADHKTLFVTTDTHVWYATVNIPGLP